MSAGSDPKAVLDAQRKHWEEIFLSKPEMFGENPSWPAIRAAELFKREGRHKLIELGAGQGRDTLFLAHKGFQICALDYSEKGLKDIAQRCLVSGLSNVIQVIRHDARHPLPFSDGCFDGCYSHMLYCMALTTAELESLSDEIGRVLKPGCLNVYTVRHTGDPDYRKGFHRGEEMYEVAGFVVHFFSRDKVASLARGWDLLAIEEFEEGRLPRKLFAVTLRKK